MCKHGEIIFECVQNSLWPQETREEKAKENEGNKRKFLQQELATVKRKKVELETVVSSLQQDNEKYLMEADEKEDLKEIQALIIKDKLFKLSNNCKRKMSNNK